MVTKYITYYNLIQLKIEEGASSAGVPPSMPQDTVTPPVTDDSESEAEDLGEDDDDNGDGDDDGDN